MLVIRGIQNLPILLLPQNTAIRHILTFDAENCAKSRVCNMHSGSIIAWYFGTYHVYFVLLDSEPAMIPRYKIFTAPINAELVIKLFRHQ